MESWLPKKICFQPIDLSLLYCPSISELLYRPLCPLTE